MDRSSFLTCLHILGHTGIQGIKRLLSSEQLQSVANGGTAATHVQVVNGGTAATHVQVVNGGTAATHVQVVNGGTAATHVQASFSIITLLQCLHNNYRSPLYSYIASLW